MYAQHAGTRRWQKIINHESIKKSSLSIYNTSVISVSSGNQNQTGQENFHNSQFYNQVDWAPFYSITLTL